MQPDRVERIAEIVERALETGGDNRSSLLHELCGGDTNLRSEVESLLGFEDVAGGFMDKPAYQAVADRLLEPEGELRPDDTLAQYRIVSLIGAGGMGEVYLAEDTSLGRRVAIKLLKFGLGTADIIRHFHQEERILAGLTHPNIAQLYGGAVTPNGLPYFVMEYVDGKRLDDYCRERIGDPASERLSIGRRLELFQKICAAVSYAHQRLVVHRDLKPANIRVTEAGEPKLLDFGIAKLLDPAGAIEQTITLAAVMTPDYASPEQIRGENITTASDVYSLGVILYELLSGQKPYKIAGRSAANLARAITEQEPTKPSTAFMKAGNRTSNMPKLKSLRGDLDNIVMKALRKEPERRYSSVAQFSEDLRRHLEGRPVGARKDTVGYRAAKFVRRNRLAVSAAAVVLVAVMAGLVVALWQAEVARHQRDVAQREKLKAERINDFLQDMLGAAAPEMKGVDVKIVDLLGEASRRARIELANQPDLMADVLMTLGRTYISLGLFGRAADDLRVAVDKSVQTNGELHSTSATSMGWLGLALVYQDKPTEGEVIARKAVELQRKLHPDGNADLGVALYSLGMNLVAKGDAKSAEPHLEQAVDLIGKHLGKNHGYYLATLTALALAREKSGNIDGAEMVYRRAIAAGQGVEQRYLIFLAQATGYCGSLLINKGEYAEAETMLNQSESLYREVLGDSNSSVPAIQTSLGRLYFVKGDYIRAETQYRKALEQLPNFFPREHFLPVSTKGALGLTLTRLGNAAEGEPLLREALEIRKSVLPKENYMIPFTESALGECLLVQKRFAEAEPLLVDGLNGMKAKLGATDPRVIEGQQRLDQLKKAR
jgi:serine/threonine protein kinase